MRLTEDRHYLVTENMGLVSKYANKMAMANRDAALDYEDFFSAGCMGLIHAAARFDTTSELQFSTYATRCIIGQIKRHKNKVSQIYVPVLVKETAAAITKDGLDIDGTSIKDMAARYGVTIKRIKDALHFIDSNVYSADAPITFDDETTLLDTLGTPDIDPTVPLVEEFIETLKPREQQIVKGLLDDMTMREIGVYLGVSFQRIGAQIKDIRMKWLDYERKSNEVSYG
ncbi:RNA polymerase sporulation-specific sigma factor [Paenibacillus sp. BK033]|uniref:sigma-70 family RNA polymerase sigma factor n=1 Tax=Paenibacillus sp. BK033 TaxID=2512133 RepID=UPI00104604CE|nr:sigma-70 family RNA polymerase sigma factor [Paenibacillus sp. BK033]TCN00901.1 RNA polymerase sporulation-specific sigma factor [Paenibacillus sp. BK033]